MIKLTTYTRTTKDAKGCEFKYIFCGSYEMDYDLDKKKSYRRYLEKDYFADFDNAIRAKSLKELQQKVAIL